MEEGTRHRQKSERGKKEVELSSRKLPWAPRQGLKRRFPPGLRRPKQASQKEVKLRGSLWNPEGLSKTVGARLGEGVKVRGTESSKQRKQLQFGKSSLCLETTKASARLRHRDKAKGPPPFLFGDEL